MQLTATFIENMKDIFSALSEYLGQKMVFAWFIGATSYLVGSGNMHLIGTLTVLVVIDFVTGVYSAYKTGEPIESRRMVKTAIKWTLYMLMISAAHLTESLVPGGDFFLASVTIAFLGATELISILENIGKTGVAIPQKLLNKLESFRDQK